MRHERRWHAPSRKGAERKGAERKGAERKGEAMARTLTLTERKENKGAERKGEAVARTLNLMLGERAELRNRRKHVNQLL